MTSIALSKANTLIKSVSAEHRCRKTKQWVHAATILFPVNPTQMTPRHSLKAAVPRNVWAFLTLLGTLTIHLGVCSGSEIPSLAAASWRLLFSIADPRGDRAGFRVVPQTDNSRCTWGVAALPGKEYVGISYCGAVDLRIFLIIDFESATRML